MEMAAIAANQSYAERLKVGALAVKDNRILSVGYNGTPPGDSNECEDWYTQVDKNGAVTTYSQTSDNVIHAEMNLIYKMARDGESAKGAELFITHSPCFKCALAIHSVGFSKVYFSNAYRSEAGIEYLKERGVEVKQL